MIRIERTRNKKRQRRITKEAVNLSPIIRHSTPIALNEENPTVDELPIFQAYYDLQNPCNTDIAWQHIAVFLREAEQWSWLVPLLFDKDRNVGWCGLYNLSSAASGTR